MRINYISYSTIPSRSANSIHVIKMCQAFRQEGHEVELLAPRRRGESRTTTTDAFWEHYGVHDPFAVRWFDTMERFREYHYAWSAARYARHTQPDLVLTRSLVAAVYAALLGLPTIWEAHMPLRDLAQHWWFGILSRAKGFRRLITITYALRTYYLNLWYAGLIQNRVEVMPDAIDLERFQNLATPHDAQRRLGLAPASLTLGYAGHLYAGRGIELILELGQLFPDYRFLVMGGEDTTVQKYRQEAASAHLHNVHLLGFIPNGQLLDYLAACDILLMPYQRRVAPSGERADIAPWFSPMKMFEYMATGRLIISSDLPVLREVLSDANSILCEPDNRRAWQEAIRCAAANPDVRQKLGRQARQDVQRYTWRQRAERILTQCLRAPHEV